MELAQAEAAALDGQPEQREEHILAAQQIAIRGLMQKPPALKLEYILAQVALEQGDVAGSIKAFEEGLSHFPDILHGADPEGMVELRRIERQLLFGLADLKTRFPDNRKATPSMGSLLDRMRQLGTPPEYLDFLLAERAIQDNEWAKAIQKLEPLKIALRSERDLSQRIGLLLSHCYRAVGNPDARLAVLNRAIEEYPLWTAGRLEYARALADVQHTEEAAKEYRLLLGVEGVASELFRLRMLEELARPQNRRDWARVEETLELAARANVDPIQLNTLRAEVLLQQQKYDQAAELLQSGLEKKPDRVSTHAAVALLALRREDWAIDRRVEACRNALTQAEARFGPLAEWELIRAEIALIEAETDARKTLDALTRRAGDYPPDQGRRLLERVAHTYRQRDLPEQSRTVWRTLAERFPNRLEYWQALAQPLSDQGRLDELRPILEPIRRIEGGRGPTSEFLLAVALLVRVSDGRGQSNELNQATEILDELARQHPRWTAVVRARGNAAELGGNSDQALRHFQEALRLGDSSPEVVLRILQNLAGRGQHDEAMQLARRLAAQGNPVFAGEAGRFARALALEQQDLEGAVRFAEQVWKSSHDYWDQLWLAEVRYQSGERGPEVDELYRQAVKQAPEQPATWLSLIRHLQRTGQFAQARAMIAEAKDHLPDRLMPPTLARCYEILGDVEEAAKWHEQAVAADSGNVSRLKAAALFHDRIGNHDKAQAYLGRIARNAKEARPSDVAWTRRNQALLLAAEGGYDRSVQAVELLERNDRRRPSGEMVEDLKAKAIILGKRPLRKDRLEAIQVLREIQQARGYLTIEERLQLARLYEATAQWTNAKKTYQEIATSDSARPEHLAEFAVSLIRHDEASQAAAWVRTLERQAPDAFVTATTQAQFRHSMGNAELAVSTLKQWVASHRPPELDARIRALPERAEFETSLTNLLAQSPADSTQEAGHLLSEARKLVEQSRVDDAKALVHQFVMRQDLKRRNYASQLQSGAVLLEELGLLEGAEELYRDYADFSAQPYAAFVLAKFLSRQHRIQEALDLCERVRGRADPDMLAAASVSVLGRSGIIGSQNISDEQFRRVESWVKSALAASFQSPACLVALADLRLLEERLREAETLYLQVLPANDRHVVALNNLAWLEAFLHDKPAEALRWINRAIEVAGPRADLLDTRAVIHIRARCADEAVRDLETALDESSFAIGYLHLAEARRLKGISRRRGGIWRRPATCI